MPAKRAAPADLQEILASGEFYMSLRFDESEFACHDFDEPSDFVHETTGRVTLADTSGAELVEVGKFRVVQIDGDGLLAQNTSISDAFDQAQETWDYFENLYVDYGFNDRVLHALDIEDDVVPLGLTIITDLVIYPEHRRKDYGLLALKTLLQRFRMGAGVIAIWPYPDQFRGEFTPEALKRQGIDMYRSSERASILRLRAHFSQLGFRLIPETEIMAITPLRALENVSLTKSLGG